MIATPFISPKYTNFQSAPCHKPETANVINMGKSSKKITLDELLKIKTLPKYNEIGEYKYNIKNRVTVICQRFQKSIMEDAL